MDDIYTTILSEYQSSPVLTSYIERLNGAGDPEGDIDLVFYDIWNVATASLYGLEIWGRIVGVSRTIRTSFQTYIGFSQQYPGVASLQGGIWYIGKPDLVSPTLDADTFRQLVLAKAYANISNGSVISMNRAFMTLFPGQGNIWVKENGNQSMSVMYDWKPSSLQLAIIKQLGSFMRPCGCAINYIYSQNGS